MDVTVLYFAYFRDRVGTERETFALSAGALVSDAIAAIEARHPQVGEMRGRYRVAVNQAFVALDHGLVAGDVLVLIPPVAGGMAPYVAVLATPLALDRCIAAVAHAGAGGVVTFTGNVRAENRGLKVTRLHYEAYEAMAVRELTAIASQLMVEHPGVALAVEHRVGTLEVGESAVVIAASAPHRAAAFVACEQMIERLKASVPIWKKEFTTDGAVWIGSGP